MAPCTNIELDLDFHTLDKSWKFHRAKLKTVDYRVHKQSLPGFSPEGKKGKIAYPKKTLKFTFVYAKIFTQK